MNKKELIQILLDMDTEFYPILGEEKIEILRDYQKAILYITEAWDEMAKVLGLDENTVKEACRTGYNIIKERRFK